MFLKKIWCGDVPLLRVYWVFGVVGEFLLVLPFLVLLLALTEPPETEVANLFLGYLAFILVYTLWAFVGIWRSAAKHRGDSSLTAVARISVALGTLLIVGFLATIFFAEV